jgi:uncharacterized glyoxalase superfamily protein PhnB
MTMTNDTTNDATTSNATIIPILVYEDIVAGHDYLVETFGFTSGGIHRDDGGIAVHAEVRMGDAVVWLHRVTPEHEMVSPRDSVTATGGLEVIVPDVDAHYARSVAGGARIDRPPTDQAYGLREYGTRDPENHRWWFSSPL